MKMTIAGMVEKFVTITPKKIFLKGFAGDSIEQKVTIKSVEKYPFRVAKTRTQNGKHIKFELKEMPKGKGYEYELLIKNTRTDPGRYYDTIFLDTVDKNQPEIKIRVSGNVQAKKGKEVKGS